jgi:hypothetical protein
MDKMNVRESKYSPSGAGIGYLSGAHEFIPVFSGVRVTRSLVLFVYFVDVVCPFVLFLLVENCSLKRKTTYSNWKV